MKALLLVLVFTFAMLLPECEDALATMPNVYLESEVVDLLQDAYDIGQNNSHCKLPVGPKVPRRKTSTSL